MNSPKRHLITSALPYANGPIHIGHVVGCFLPADIYARFLRLKGEEVLFVSGTDEHGVPITLKAKNEGKTPQQVVDEQHAIIRSSLEQLGISFDHFSRTTRPIHHETAREFFTELQENNSFSVQETEQLYDEQANQFLADRYITGTCPNCEYDQAYGDQCENCGRSLNPKDLINPKSVLTGNEPTLKKTVNWYLPLDRIQESFLNDFISSKKDTWKSNVHGQCMSWLNDGLQPRAMTRDLDWGVKVPLPEAENKVMYVWFDAPIGYISSTKEHTDQWETWWKSADTELTHFIGKDNIVFHCIIFPAMLQEHGDYILPTHVPANEFLNLEGQKISTSRNHAIWLHEYLSDFPDKKDELRYVLTAIMPETKDSDFTWKDFQARVNNELVAIAGNFVNRVVVLTHKFCDGVVPEADIDPQITEQLEGLNQQISGHLSSFRFRDAQTAFMEVARLGNGYLQEKAPWHAIKEDNGQAEVNSCLRSCIEVVRQFARWSKVFLPDTALKLEEMLNGSPDEAMQTGTPLKKVGLLFEKIEDETIEEQLEKLKSNDAPESALPAIGDTIQFDDFAKLDLRVGTVTAVDKVKKADRLLQLTIDIGLETRTVLSGIAEHFSPEEVQGQQVVLVANLAPRKMRGIESQGMVLMAENEEGKLQFVAPPAGFQNGAVVR
jgi:methionyl-tRNA synthetase